MEDPLVFLDSELQVPNLQIQINAMSRLPIIVFSMDNHQQRKQEIINYLLTIIKKNEFDEILFTLARTIGDLAEYFQLEAMKVLEPLFVNEETVIRQEALNSFVKTLPFISQSELTNIVLPNIYSLKSDSQFTGKVAQLDLMVAVFPLCQIKDQPVLLTKIVGMIQEESLIIRRNLAKHMGTLCKYVKKEILLHGFIKQFKTLAIDDQDSVRIVCMDSIVQIAKCLDAEENKQNIIPIVITLVGDKSWKVKLYLSNIFSDLAETLGPEITDNSLYSIFSTLLRDLENEVRVSSMKTLVGFVKFLSQEKIVSTLSSLQQLSKDNVSLVRVYTCIVIGEILKIKQRINIEIIKQKIAPIIVELLQDEDKEVQIEALKLVSPWTELAHQNVLDLIQQGAINLHSNNRNWRIRLQEYKSILGVSLHSDEQTFIKNFKQYYFKSLLDPVFDIRLQTAQWSVNLKKILSQQELLNVMRHIKSLCENKDNFYSIQITAFMTLKNLFFDFNDNQIREEMLQFFSSSLRTQQKNIINTILIVLEEIYFHKEIKQNEKQKIYTLFENFLVEKDIEISNTI